MHIWLWLYPVWLVVFGVTGSIPKRDAHLYIYIYIYPGFEAYKRRLAYNVTVGISA